MFALWKARLVELLSYTFQSCINLVWSSAKSMMIETWSWFDAMALTAPYFELFSEVFVHLLQDICSISQTGCLLYILLYTLIDLPLLHLQFQYCIEQSLPSAGKLSQERSYLKRTNQYFIGWHCNHNFIAIDKQFISFQVQVWSRRKSHKSLLSYYDCLFVRTLQHLQ